MKVGILTFWTSGDNYGQLLQCYALQRYYISNGDTPFLIRYDGSEKAEGYTIDYSEIPDKEAVKRSIIERDFDGFRDKYIYKSDRVYHFYNELKQDPPKADMYVVGSDQVWNLGFNKELLCPRAHAFFLDFGAKDIPRHSYAASWGQFGKKEILEIRDEISPLLAKFERVTVREESGIERCKLCGRNDAERTNDPTLLLDADDYRKLYIGEAISKREKPFVLVYWMKTGRDFPFYEATKWADSKGMDLIYVTGNHRFDGLPSNNATIPEWLYYMDHAECVITNSFHGCVFSSIFGTKLVIEKTDSVYGRMDDRLQSVINTTGVKPQYLSGSDFWRLPL